MEDSTKTLLKWGAAAVGAYLLYQYLQSSGLWAQWFGGSSQPAIAPNQFSDNSLLLAFCALNPTSVATFIDASGAQTTLSCVAWLMNDGRIPTKQSAAAPAAAQAATVIDPRIAQLQQVAGGDSFSVEQWNTFYQQLQAGAAALPAASSGNVDASTYISLRNAAGLSGVPSHQYPTMGYDDTYEWGN